MQRLIERPGDEGPARHGEAGDHRKHALRRARLFLGDRPGDGMLIAEIDRAEGQRVKRLQGEKADQPGIGGEQPPAQDRRQAAEGQKPKRAEQSKRRPRPGEKGNLAEHAGRPEAADLDTGKTKRLPMDAAEAVEHGMARLDEAAGEHQAESRRVPQDGPGRGGPGFGGVVERPNGRWRHRQGPCDRYRDEE